MSAMKMNAPRSTLTNSGSLSLRSSYISMPMDSMRAAICFSVYSTFKMS